jgi:hypothetical protein
MAAKATRGLLDCLSSDIVFMSELVFHGRVISSPENMHWKGMTPGTVYETNRHPHRMLVTQQMVTGWRRQAGTSAAAMMAAAAAWGVYARRLAIVDVKTAARRAMRSLVHP